MEWISRSDRIFFESFNDTEILNDIIYRGV